MVRATFAGFSTAYSALQANQKRLDIVGQNLANMNTVGYTRQQLQVSSLNYTNPVSHYMSSSEVVVGFGVHMDKVTQVRDPYLDIQYREQMHKSGYSNAMQTSLDELSRFFDESTITGIRKAFDDIQSTLTNMQDGAKVSDAVFQTELRTRMQALTNLLNEGARKVETAKQNEYSRLDGTGTSEQGAIDRVNDILQQIGHLNRQIKDNQIYGQPSLELMDERNVLLDELASYIPIEVTYYKDKEHDGLDAEGNYKADDLALKSEQYYLDSSGNIIMKKEWPDDLRVTMSYLDENGDLQKLVLVEGTVGSGDANYGQLEIANSADILSGNADPSELQLKFVNCFETPKVAAGKPYYGVPVKEITFQKGVTGAAADPNKITKQFPTNSGSIQASLDMLWQDGTTPGLDRVNGYDYYMDQLDRLAYMFGTVINVINLNYAEDGNTGWLVNGLDKLDGAAKNIKIHSDWVSGKSHIGTKGDNPTDAVMDMLEAMTTVYYSDPNKNKNYNFLDSDGKPKYDGTVGADLTNVNLDNNTFAGFINHVSTVLANDSYANKYTLKNNVTVLNGIQNSRDSVSGISLDEEASNMMMHMSAYNAASRLMTTLDQALDVLINGTGVVGR